MPSFSASNDNNDIHESHQQPVLTQSTAARLRKAQERLNSTVLKINNGTKVAYQQSKDNLKTIDKQLDACNLAIRANEHFERTVNHNTALIKELPSIGLFSRDSKLAQDFTRPDYQPFINKPTSSPIKDRKKKLDDDPFEEEIDESRGAIEMFDESMRFLKKTQNNVEIFGQKSQSARLKIEKISEKIDDSRSAVERNKSMIEQYKNIYM